MSPPLLPFFSLPTKVYWWGTNDGLAADSFMRDLSNMTNASVPLFVSPGNGEAGGKLVLVVGSGVVVPRLAWVRTDPSFA